MMGDADASTGRRKRRSLTGKTVEGLFWSGLGSATFALSQLVVVAVLARLLVPEEFGLVTAAGTVTGLSFIFVNLGVAPAIVQQRELTDSHIATGVTLSVMMGFAMGVIVAGLSPAIAWFYGMPELTPVLATLALLFPISSFGLVAGALLQRDMRFRRLSLRNLSSYIVGYGIVSIVLAFLGFGVWALVFGQLAQSCMQMSQNVAVSGRRIRFGWDRDARRDLLSYGIGSTLARTGNLVANQGDYMVVGGMLGPAALGFYGRSYQFISMPSNLFGSVTDRVLFPALASVQDDPAKLERAYRQSIGILAMVTLPLSGLLFVVAPEAVGVLLGEGWDPVIAPLQLLVLSLVFRTSTKISDSLSRASAAVMNRAWRQWVYAGAVIGGAALGARWGLIGVAAGVSVAIILNFALMLDLSRKLSGVRLATLAEIYLRHAAMAAVTTGIAFAVLTIARNAALPAIARLVVASGVAAAAWLALVRLAPRLAGEELDGLLSIVGSRIRRRRHHGLAREAGT